MAFEPKDFLFAHDYAVRYISAADVFDVAFRRGGCFEGAYRCIERFIEAKSEEFDGLDTVPTGHLDLRRDMQYWMFELVYDRFLDDVDAALAERVAWLERTRPGEVVAGDVRIEVRSRMLAGVRSYLDKMNHEVRRGCLSPRTLRFLKQAGYDLSTREMTI